MQLRAKAIIMGLKKGKISKGSARCLFETLISDFFDEIGLTGEECFDAFTLTIGLIDEHLLGHDIRELPEEEESFVIDMFDTENHGLF